MWKVFPLTPLSMHSNPFKRRSRNIEPDSASAAISIFIPSTHRKWHREDSLLCLAQKKPSMWKRLKIKFYCFRLQSDSHLLYAFPSCVILTLGLSVLAQHSASFPWTIKILRMMFASLLWQFSSRNRFNQNFIELLSSYLYAQVGSALERLLPDKM